MNYGIKLTTLLITSIIEGLDDAAEYHWVLADMKADRKRIYSFDK
jgi:hypothetical protein